MLEEDGGISDLRAINVEEDKLEEVMTDGLGVRGINQCMTGEVGAAGLGGGHLLRSSANAVSMNFCRLLEVPEPIYKPTLIPMLSYCHWAGHDAQVDFEGKDGAHNHSANMAEAMDEISIDETGLKGSECTIDGGGEKVRYLELHSNLYVDIVPSLCGV